MSFVVTLGGTYTGHILCPQHIVNLVASHPRATYYICNGLSIAFPHILGDELVT